jgi:hypothetical protein
VHLAYRIRYDRRMNIRSATLEDVEAIHELGKAVNEFAVNDETVTFWPKDLLGNAVQSDDALMYVATLVPPNAQGAINLYKRAGFSQGETFLWLDKTLADNFKQEKTI